MLWDISVCGTLEAMRGRRTDCLAVKKYLSEQSVKPVPRPCAKTM